MMPNGHALEVRAVGVGIADALDNGQSPVLNEVGGRFHSGMQADRVVELRNFIGFDSQLAAEAGVVLVGKWNDSVQAIVSTVELDHDQDSVVRLGGGREARSRKERRHQ